MKPYDKNSVARELGVQFGTTTHNRNLTAGACGAVGGEMVKRALDNVWNQQATPAYMATQVIPTHFSQYRQ